MISFLTSVIALNLTAFTRVFHSLKSYITSFCHPLPSKPKEYFHSLSKAQVKKKCCRVAATNQFKE